MGSAGQKKLEDIMALPESLPQSQKIALRRASREKWRQNLATFPWWLAAIGLVIAITLYLISNAPTFSDAVSV